MSDTNSPFTQLMIFAGQSAFRVRCSIRFGGKAEARAISSLERAAALLNRLAKSGVSS